MPTESMDIDNNSTIESMDIDNNNNDKSNNKTESVESNNLKSDNDSTNNNDISDDTSATKENEYPVYTEDNPMKLPNEESNDFIVGIDFGNETSVVSIAKFGELTHHPYVLHNTLGDLKHKALVSYTDDRTIGSSALSHCILHPQKTICDIKYLNNQEQNDIIEKQYPFKLILNNNTYSSIIIPNSSYFNDNDEELSFSQIISAFIRKFISFSKTDLLYWQFRDKILRQRIPKDIPVEKRDIIGLDVNKCVLAVPSCYTAKQRAAILDAGSICGIEIVKLIDEGIASALTYTMSRSHDLKEQNNKEDYPESVIVIDIGHSYFHISIANIGINKIDILHSSSLSIGANHFNNKLSNHIGNILKTKYSISDDLSLRSKARLQRAVEKTIKVLSTVTQSTVDIENFINGVDVREPITRIEFEDLCSDYLLQISSHIQNAMKEALLNTIFNTNTSNNSTKVEIIGGGCRIPSVQSKIKQATNTEQLHFNLDSNTSIAVGAAIYGSLIYYNGDYDIEDQTFEYNNSYINKDIEDNLNKEINNYRLSQDIINSLKDKENKMFEKDEELRKSQELRNSYEQFIYQYYDDINTLQNESLSNEISSLTPLLDNEKSWLLYNDESFSLSFNDLTDHFNSFKENLEKTAPQFHNLLMKRKEQKEKEERDAAEVEAKRTVTHRDKIKNPKTPKEKLDAAIARKDQGNKLYTDLNYEHAITRYLQAINLLTEIPGEKYKEDIEKTKISCYLNLAMSYINVKKYKLAIENCNLVLRIDENNIKALFRRGKSKYGQKLYKDAKTDFQLALDKDPSNKPAKKQIILCDKQIKLQLQREKKMCSKMFG